jgi:hypothetical protein
MGWHFLCYRCAACCHDKERYAREAAQPGGSRNMDKGIRAPTRLSRGSGIAAVQEVRRKDHWKEIVARVAWLTLPPNMAIGYP